MAWRDSRGSRRRLLLFLLSMVLGVAALVSINSFGVNLRETVDAESRSLLGADLSLESGRKFSEEAEALIDSLGGEQSRSITFPSMAFFPRSDATRLVTVRALRGDYPYYGAIETEPAGAARSYLARRGALVDATLMNQFHVSVGDSVRIGDITYPVAGRLISTPRENQAMMLLSPRVYVPLDSLDTSLLGLGSRADYEAYLKFPPGTDVEALTERLEPRFKELHVGYDTVEEV
ncbi:MAG TPA: ABC transporter permease, partial [Rhodothermales bacterium]|nr:ABC transporter permease [Rhodothermales bacterium]